MNQRGIKQLKLPWTNVFAWENLPPSVNGKGHTKKEDWLISWGRLHIIFSNVLYLVMLSLLYTVLSSIYTVLKYCKIMKQIN